VLYKLDTVADVPAQTFFRIGDRMTASCLPADGLVYYELGEQVPLAVASLDREHVAGRRFEHHYLTLGGWRGRSMFGLHDNKYELDCDLVASGPNAGYCSMTPSCGEVREVYLDPACRTEVTMFDHTGCAGPAPLAVGRRAIVANDKPETQTFREMETYPGPRYACVPAEVRRLYMLVDEIPLDAFTPFVDRD
jgi:hypothetical protein